MIDVENAGIGIAAFQVNFYLGDRAIIFERHAIRDPPITLARAALAVVNIIADVSSDFLFVLFAVFGRVAVTF